MNDFIKAAFIQNEKALKLVQFKGFFCNKGLGFKLHLKEEIKDIHSKAALLFVIIYFQNKILK